MQPSDPQPPAMEGRVELDARLLATVRRLASDVVEAHQRHAELLGLSSIELRGLEVVAAGETNAGRLAETLGLTTGAVTGLLDRLEQRGLIRRRQDPDDRRRVLVALREDTAGQLAGVPDPLAAAVGELLQVAGPSTLTTVDRLLAVLDLALRDELRRLGQRLPAPQVGGPLRVAGRGVTEARLVVGAGLNNVTMQTAAIPDLCRAEFGGREVELTEAGGTITLAQRRRPLFGGWIGPGTITLQAGLTWRVEVAGGSNRWTADLTGVRLERLAVRGGGSRIGVALPAPQGTVPVSIGGGVSRCEIRVPESTPLRLHTRGGASKLRIGDLRLGAVGGNVDWQSPDFEGAADRYDVTVGGGADRLEILSSPAR